jgi:hypothetical protein
MHIQVERDLPCSFIGCERRNELGLMIKRCNEEGTLRLRLRQWVHDNLCGNLYVLWVGTYVCSDFCKARMKRDAEKGNRKVEDLF